MSTHGPGPGLDRLLRLEAGAAAVATLSVPGTLSIFDSHFPRFPVLPGVLLLDAVAALAGTALGPGSWELESVEQVRYRHFVRPGDQVELTVTVLDRGPAPASCAARATVEGRLVATVRRLSLRLRPAPVLPLGERRAARESVGVTW
jgi:3-hydroxyacyl-[acyl-carrier-protein] dehydratase